MDFNLTNEERSKALKICCEHLRGAWENVPQSDVKISRLSGGMTNLLYYCALLDCVKTSENEPKQVLLRIYGPSHSDTEVQLDVFKQLAQENLGPSLYGTFDGGRLEEYLPSDALTWHQMTSSEISAVVAKKLAAIHKLNVSSLDKSSNWLLDKYNTYYDFLTMLNKKNPPIFSEEVLESTKLIAMDLLNIDFKPEIEYMAKLFQNSKAPLVFSHNDLHQNNIILLHGDSDKDQPLYDRVVLIDFEYCCYNYRTFDAANHLSEWCFDYNTDEYPHFSFSKSRFPSEERQLEFLNYYATQTETLDRGDYNSSTNGFSNKKNKTLALFDEMQPFLMASNLLWTLWAVRSALTSKIRFGYWEMAKCKWEMYLLCKERFIKRSKNTLGCDVELIVQSSKM